MTWSYQLYSSRNHTPWADVLSGLGKAGYKGVEGFGGVYEDPKAFASELKKNGLKMPTGHFPIEMLEKNDANKVERAAHRMNGSSSMVGAKQLAKACAAIEQSARKKDMAGVKAVMASLDEAIKQLENFLSTLEVKYQSTIDQE
mgnify:CR=1 FL=1